MKTKFIVYCLLSVVCFFSSCSSGTKNENKSANENAVDTSLHGLTGVIEKNPPVQQGDYISKYSSGIVKIKGFYLNGKRNGQWISFFENGNMQSEGFFKAGLRDGKATVYYEDGKVYYEGYYKDGKEIGKWLFYDESGKKINEKDYDKPNS
jgi:antitoxin component YwqK of YwqJK toxin-antitoxin module